MTKSLKWRGFDNDISEYESACGRFLVQLKDDKLWHLFQRTFTQDEDDAADHHYSPSGFTNKKKGECQKEAEKLVDKPAPEHVESSHTEKRASPGREREDLSESHDSYELGHNSSCWCCNVSFTKKEGHKFGDLCGTNCLGVMEEVLSEVEK